MQTMSTEPRFHRSLQQVLSWYQYHSRTNWMGSLGISVYADYKSTTPPQSEDSVTELQGSMEFFGIILVKVNVCRWMSAK